MDAKILFILGKTKQKSKIFWNKHQNTWRNGKLCVPLSQILIFIKEELEK